jgi:ribosome maturation protein SDO1
MRVSQPVGQKRHTNIAVVSIRKKVEGKDYKFEIACYPNKVLNQREGLEKDLDQVLQTDTIFTNVSRGDIATHEDLITCFGTTNHRKICIEIIKEGHLQVSEKEREYLNESRSRDVLNMLTQMTMDATTGYPLTVTQIQAALDDIHYHISGKSSLKGSRSIKHRDEEEEVKLIARECVKKLETELPHRISRVNMMLRVVFKSKISASEITKLAEEKCLVTNEDAHAFLITCHPRLMKLLKDTYGDDIESLSVVDSFVHKILPNTVPPSPPKKPPTQSSVDASPKVITELKRDHHPNKTHQHACGTCGDTSFESATEFRVHCRSEWHAFNKKREVKGLPFIDHLEFELLPDELKLNFNAVDP